MFIMSYMGYNIKAGACSVGNYYVTTDTGGYLQKDGSIRGYMYPGHPRLNGWCWTEAEAKQLIHRALGISTIKYKN